MVDELLDYTARLGGYSQANVVGTREWSRLLLDHILDSLSCLLHTPVLGSGRLVDVGSGGGLPGIPIKIVRPSAELTLLEATGKKAKFLRQVSEDLGLKNTEVVNERAEIVGREPGYREKYDVATARALAPLPTISEYCLPLVKKGGCLLAMKARPDSAEIEAGRKAASLLGGEVSEVVEVDFLPELPAKQRCLVIVNKVSETPREYPRRTGIPKKSPLGSI